jgi:hypothetical protein
MSNNLTLDKVVPVLNDLQTKLAGQNGDQVFEALKKILRGEEPTESSVFNDMIAAGHYDWVNSDITEKRFPMPKDFVLGAEPKVFHFNRDIWGCKL